jgi:hypothetical protein
LEIQLAEPKTLKKYQNILQNLLNKDSKKDKEKEKKEKEKRESQGKEKEKHNSQEKKVKAHQLLFINFQLSSQYFLSFFKTEKSFLCGEID